MLNKSIKFKIQFHSYDYDADFNENSIYLSKSILELFKLVQGNFIEINLFKNDDDKKLLNKRNCKCLSLPHAKEDTIYLSSLLWFNLTNQLIGFDGLEQFHIKVSFY